MTKGIVSGKGEAHTPLYERGMDRAKAVRIARRFMHNKPPIDCVHVWEDATPETLKQLKLADRNVKLQECKFCPMVIGWVT